MHLKDQHAVIFWPPWRGFRAERNSDRKQLALDRWHHISPQIARGLYQGPIDRELHPNNSFVSVYDRLMFEQSYASQTFGAERERLKFTAMAGTVHAAMCFEMTSLPAD